jgi:uncharacterized membrane protein
MKRFEKFRQEAAFSPLILGSLVWSTTQSWILLVGSQIAVFIAYTFMYSFNFRSDKSLIVLITNIIGITLMIMFRNENEHVAVIGILLIGVAAFFYFHDKITKRL